MTERRLTTEDLAAQRGPLGHEPPAHDAEPGGPVGQQGVVVPQEHDRRDTDPTDYDTDRDHDAEPLAHERVGHEPVEQEPFEQEPVDRDAVHEQADRGADDERPPAGDEPVEPSAVSPTAGDTSLFNAEDAADYQSEWRALQADFVDDPRQAVQRADELVAQVMQNLATTFADHKRSLEGQWQQGEQVETEELRQALKRYRSFFDRLLSV
ncbi:hypothetical protein [Saccharothrix syringae]|uniref:Uncharacterized protein n=1 Tax=Saccharothrix syringae TaxID=103733 RepID=A0A5Q0GVK5_SACSY|nr:hypothetical protein [Saccharothrix syringae]QFZ17524.1 hypothetical protein EKG83_08565 [Saccharothrix syringae]